VSAIARVSDGDADLWQSAYSIKTVGYLGRCTPSRSAISVFLSPAAASNTIWERCVSAWELVRRRDQLSS
jgi:hypothetical protein